MLMVATTDTTVALSHLISGGATFALQCIIASRLHRSVSADNFRLRSWSATPKHSARSDLYPHQLGATLRWRFTSSSLGRAIGSLARPGSLWARAYQAIWQFDTQARLLCTWAPTEWFDYQLIDILYIYTTHTKQSSSPLEP